MSNETRGLRYTDREMIYLIGLSKLDKSLRRYISGRMRLMVDREEYIKEERSKRWKRSARPERFQIPLTELRYLYITKEEASYLITLIKERIDTLSEHTRDKEMLNKLQKI